MGKTICAGHIARFMIACVLLIVLACSAVPSDAHARSADTGDDVPVAYADDQGAEIQRTVGVMATAKYTMSVKYNANGAKMSSSPYHYGSRWYRLNAQGMVQVSSDGETSWQAETTTLTSGVTESLLKVVGRCGLSKTGYHSNAGINNARYYNLKADLTGSYISSDSTTTKAVNGGSEITANVTSPVTLYVVWMPNTYTVAYDANGGSWPTGSTTSTQHTYDKTSALSASKPTRAHYTFGGWQINGSGTVYSPGQNVSNLTSAHEATVTMKAIWIEDAHYTVSYDAGGGSGYMPHETVFSGERVTVANCSFTRPGYTFGGWSASSGAAGRTYAAGDSMSLTADTVLVAQWNPLQLSFSVPSEINCTMKASGDLNFDDAGAPNIENLTDVGISVVGVKAVSAPGFALTAEPRDEGEVEYSFVPGSAQRFSASSAAGNGFASVDWPIAKQSSLQLSEFKGKIARLGSLESTQFSLGTITWRLSMREVVVTYDANGANGVMSDQEVSADVPFSAPQCGFKHANGKQFVCWCESSDGFGVRYPPGSTVSFDKDVTLFAIWQ